MKNRKIKLSNIMQNHCFSRTINDFFLKYLAKPFAVSMVGYMFAFQEILRSSCRLVTISRRGARGVVVIVVGIGHGDTSSNPGRDWLHFT